MAITTIDARQAHQLLNQGLARLIDIREPDEFARAHIPGAILRPASATITEPVVLEDGVLPILMCASGMRTTMHQERLARQWPVDTLVLKGGLKAWEAAGQPVVRNARAPLELIRQVQIAAGVLILTGLLLAWLVAPAFVALTAFVGLGLTFAGLSGFCGMARLLALMPWNRRALG